MDTIASGTDTFQYHNFPEQPINALVASSPHSLQQVRHCFGDLAPGEFPLSASPSIVLHLLTSSNLDAQDLAKLEATCSFFRRPAQFEPDHDLSLAEVAALDMCHDRAIFKPMTGDERLELKRICGGSWKLVLRFFLAGEAGYRREKSQAIAGPGHSIVVTSKGLVYSFGANGCGQLGHGTIEHNWRPQQIRSLQDIRIIQAAVGSGKTILVSDSGQVYAFGKKGFGAEYGGDMESSPQLVEPLKHIFVVQAAIANYFTAVLSREGMVYTISWGNEGQLGHYSKPDDVEPHPLLGALENVPVVQIAAGHCYLLALACQPTGMSVYSVGCGLGGKLGHATTTNENSPRLIEHFQTLNLEPVAIAAGAWHAAVIGKDGRVCTWGWGHFGCLGHGNQESELVPKIVEALSTVRAVHVAAGDYTTFVVSDEGNVYCFGYGALSSLRHQNEAADGQANRYTDGLIPKLVTSLGQVNERIVQISLTNHARHHAHTFALTESGKLFAFGNGNQGQLGVANLINRPLPQQVDVDLA